MKILKNNTKKTKVIYYGDDSKNPTTLYTGYDSYVHSFASDHSPFKPLDSNVIFEMEFTYKNYSRGRSSVTMNLTDIDTQHMYELTPKMIGSFIEMIQNGHIKVTPNKTFIGTFTLAKYGSNYSLQPIILEEE